MITDFVSANEITAVFKVCIVYIYLVICILENFWLFWHPCG